MAIKRPTKTGEGQGRRTALTEELIGIAEESILQGNYAQVVYGAMGVSATSYYGWLKKGQADLENDEDTIFSKFAKRVYAAEKESEANILKEIRKHARETKDAKTLLEILARKHPLRWGRTDRHKVEGHDGGPVKGEFRIVFSEGDDEDE